MNILERLSKSENDIIQEIHDSFDNAQDELLEQANEIISRFNPDYGEKALRLKNLGFTSTREVVNYEGKNKDLVSSKKDADLVNYYKASYPFLKFLKEEQLDAICKKYNLIYAPVSRYKEEVPVKNLTEIENAQPLKNCDVVKSNDIYHFKNIHSHKKKLFNSVKNLIGGETLNEIQIEHILNKHLDPRYHSKQELFYYISSYAKDEKGSRLFPDCVFSDCTITKVNKEGLFIAAPKSHFDLKGLNNKALGFFNITITEVKDPIVFRYVKGGIQVLSKWGLEANDPELAVGINN